MNEEFIEELLKDKSNDYKNGFILGMMFITTKISLEMIKNIK